MHLSRPIYHLKRKAKALARETNLPLHAALDSVAAGEGFSTWSLLAARHAEISPAARLFASLQPGELVMIGARPRQGKTLMALELAVEAMKAGRHSAFFSLEYTPSDMQERFAMLGTAPDSFGTRFLFDASDAISADYIAQRMAPLPAGSIAVVDYLQVLDQRRDNPPVGEQVKVLKAFAQTRGQIVICVSQIDRRYDPASKPLPDLVDVRLPNPVDLSLFDRTCFLHGGEIQFAAA